MATLQKIRNRAGLLIAIVIGIALVAFILGDFLSTGQVKFRRAQMMIAKINGTNVYYTEYFDLERDQSKFIQLSYNLPSLTEEASMRARVQAWEKLLDNYILNKEYEKLGLAVHPDELFELSSGDNPHPIVRQNFTNPETNMYDKRAALQFLMNVQSGNYEENEQLRTQRELWLQLEDQIYNDQLRKKFNTLFNKGIYITGIEVKRNYIETRSKTAFRYISKNYSSVPDSAINVSSSDIKEYYKEHINKYQNKEETRSIEYVTFEIVPSKEDDEATKEWITNLKPDFEKVDDVEIYVNANSDPDKQFDPSYYAYDELSGVYQDELYNNEVGAVYGPIFENGAYKLARLVKTENLPDSVRAKQIFLYFDGSVSYEDLKAKADSFVTIINNGMNFSLLAESVSDDQESAQVGGDLGWFSQNQVVNQTMTRSVVDSCFFAELNKPQIVTSPYGLHIIKVTDKSRKSKKVQIAVIERKVEASKETIEAYYRQALQFAAENNTYEKFKNTVENSPEIRSTKANDLKKGDQGVMGMPNTRNIIQWAFTAEEGDVTQEVVELSDNFLVAALSEVDEEGDIPLEKVEEDIKIDVIREKKGEYLQKQLQESLIGENSLENIAQKLDLEIVDAGEISFGTQVSMIRNAGMEPAVVGVATATDPGSIAGPIIGNNGVFVINVDDRIEADKIDESSIGYYKRTMDRNIGLRNEAPNALREMAEIEDKRINFF